jgi:hypothetical protein
MSDYDKEKKLHSDLAEIARKHNVTIVTATQPQRENNHQFERNSIRDSIMVIDHINLIKINRIN